MNKENLIIWIKNFLLKDSGSLYPARARDNFLISKYNDYYNLIISLTSYLDENVNVSERLYHILNDITGNVLCRKCNNKTEFVKFSMGYRKYCSNRCMDLDKDYLNKIRIDSCINTVKSKYNVNNVFELEFVKNKIKKTNIEKYGCENAFQNIEIRERQKNKMIKKYGVDHNMKSDYLKDKIKKKYNGILPLHSKKSKDKIKKTFHDKYNLFHPAREHFSKDVFCKLNNKKWLLDQNKEKCCSDIAKELSVGVSTVIRYMNIFDIEIKYHKISSGHKEVIDFINLENVIANKRSVISPYELDVYLPDYKLAIEFNGIFWHSRHDDKYHLNKTKLCENKNIQLFHIFESEWIYKKDIWKSIISNKLGRNNKIYARKCEVRNIDNNVTSNFLKDNHLQGYCFSKVKLGLFYNNELVSVMTFGKSRFSKKYEWEMIRFCNKKYLSVIGGASKLYKYFIDNYKPKSIVTYSDKRYSNGNLYKKLGFEFSHSSNPNYWYFKNGNDILYSRVKFQKHKLSKILENFDSSKSEYENMKNNNYHRIFDCGNDIFIYFF